MHSVEIIGNLGSDAVKRFTPTGLPVANFSIASNRTRQNGEEVTTWFRVAAWGKLADVMAEYAKKGRLMYIRGVLAPQCRVWTDTEGNSRAGYEVSVREFKFLDKRTHEAGDELAGLIEYDSDGLPIGVPVEEDLTV